MKRRFTHSRFWTKTEDEALRRFAPQGLRELRRHLPHRSVESIKHRAYKLGLSVSRYQWSSGEYRWRGRLPIPPHAHPLVRKFFAEVNREKALLSEVAERSGVSVGTMTDWRYRRSPLIETFIAALNVIDLDLAIVHRQDASEQ